MKGGKNKEEKKDTHILVVDDEQGMRDLLTFELGNQGYHVTSAASGEEALACLRKEKIHLVISDVKMPNLTGIALLDEIKKIDPEIEVIIATGYGTIETAVEAMKKGAYDFIQKPFNLNEIFAVVDKALEKSEMKALIALYESSKTIFSTIQLSEVLDIVMSIVQKVFSADQGSIMLLNSEKKLYIATSRGIKPEIAQNVLLEIGERVAGRVAKEKKGVILVDTLDRYPEFKGIRGKPDIRSSIVHPIMYRDELLGVLNLNRTQSGKAYTPSDLRSVAIFASQLAQAIQNAKLYQKLQRKMEELQRAYKTLEETKDQLVRTEKLASLGRFVAGIAHEINNPLTAVLGYTQMLLHSKKTHVEDKVRTRLEIVAREAERCSEIVMDLLNFSRPRKPHLTSVDPCQLLDEALDALKLQFDKDKIEVKRSYPAARRTVPVDSQQLCQVFLNILNNADHALQKVSRARKLEVQVTDDQQYVKIRIADNGTGIPKSNLPKIFDPFFTTKETGKGTGLGLSLCYSMVREHGGLIGVESKEGKGSAFEVRLPKGGVRAEKKDLTAKTIGPRKVAGDHAKVLVVENESSILSWVSDFLESRGYETDTAADGDTGMQKILKNHFDLVICDFHLPGMMGDNIYLNTKKKKPDLAKRFLFITASAFGPDVEKFFNQNQIPWIHKPFTGEALIGAIEERLAA